MALVPLLRAVSARWVSVQKGLGTEQLAGLPDDVKVQLFPPDADSDGAFLDTAALITRCDAVVTSDTSIAHLAGALGVRTYVLLDDVCDWRWGRKGTLTPWYGAMTLARQTAHNDWSSAVAAVMRQMSEDGWTLAPPSSRAPVL